MKWNLITGPIFGPVQNMEEIVTRRIFMPSRFWSIRISLRKDRLLWPHIRWTNFETYHHRQSFVPKVVSDPRWIFRPFQAAVDTIPIYHRFGPSQALNRDFLIKVFISAITSSRNPKSPGPRYSLYLGSEILELIWANQNHPLQFSSAW